jgi:hypothetical protein
MSQVLAIVCHCERGKAIFGSQDCEIASSLRSSQRQTDRRAVIASEAVPSAAISLLQKVEIASAQRPRNDNGTM